MPKKLIIFDLDGTLIDSERPVNRVFSQMLAEEGLLLTLHETIHHFKGLTDKDSRHKAEELLGKKLSEDFAVRYDERVLAALQVELQPNVGVVGLLQSRKEKICVASNASRRQIQSALQITNLAPYFGSHTFSAQDVALPKPFPDLFLFALSQMGVHASDAVVIEDSPHGVRAAVTAGITVFGYADLTPEHLLVAEGAALFKSFNELATLLDTL